MTSRLYSGCLATLIGAIVAFGLAGVWGRNSACRSPIDRLFRSGADFRIAAGPRVRADSGAYHNG